MRGGEQGWDAGREWHEGQKTPFLPEEGGRHGLTWLWAALPTPHTVVTTDSDPAG